MGDRRAWLTQGGAQGQKLNSGLLKMFGFVFGWTTREDLPIGFFFLFLDTRMYFTSKKWCKTQQLNKFNHYLHSNLHSMPPREFLFFFLCEK